MNEERITNGIGPEMERKNVGSATAHRLWDRGWMTWVRVHMLRNEDGFSADRIDFTHSSTCELENNRRAFACAACIVGGCTRPIHTTNDSTYSDLSEWTPAVYVNTDHMRG